MAVTDESRADWWLKIDRSERLRFIYATVGMTFFWQLLRYSNLRAILPFDLNLTTGTSNYLYWMLTLGVLLGAAAMSYDDVVRRWMASRYFLIAIAAAATCSVFVLEFAVSDPSASSLALTAIRLICTAVFVFAFLVLLYSWTMVCSVIFGRNTKTALMCLIVSSLLTLALSLTGSLDSIFSAVVRALYPLCSGVFLLLSRSAMGNLNSQSISLAVVEPRIGARQALASLRSYPLPLISLVVFFFMLASLIKGFLTPTPSSFLDSPELIYSCFVTLVVGLVLLVVLFAFTGVKKIAYLSWIIIAISLSIGFLGLGFMGGRSPLISSAFIVTSRAWFEVFLFAVIVVAWRPDSAIHAATMLFGVPEFIASILRHVVIPVIASKLDTPISLFALKLSIPLGTLLLVSCCTVLARLAFREIAHDGGTGNIPGVTGADAVKQISETYGLTPKETIVVGYLLKGYTIPSIAEEEILALSTVQTHYRNIYLKLGIHSKKELIKLAERFIVG